MSLRCSVCREFIDEGLNFCPKCRTGFVAQLQCVDCGKLVPRGMASCIGCVRAASVVMVSPPPLPRDVGVMMAPPSSSRSTSELVGVMSPRQAPPVLPGLPSHVSLPAPVADRFVVRSGGVEAEIKIPAGDAEVMDLMGQMVVLLHTFATKMNTLSGHGEMTRQIIRSSRTLATDIQEELELRKGPGR